MFAPAQVHTRIYAKMQIQTRARAHRLKFSPADSLPVPASFALLTRKVQGPGLALARACRVLRQRSNKVLASPALRRPRLRWQAKPAFLPSRPGKSSAHPLWSESRWCAEVCDLLLSGGWGRMGAPGPTGSLGPGVGARFSASPKWRDVVRLHGCASQSPARTWTRETRD